MDENKALTVKQIRRIAGEKFTALCPTALNGKLLEVGPILDVIAEAIHAEMESDSRRRTAPSGLTHQPQMTLRDYFAGQALGIMNTAMDQGYWSPGENPNAEIAEAAYQVADAMLEARGK